MLVTAPGRTLCATVLITLLCASCDSSSAGDGGSTDPDIVGDPSDFDTMSQCEVTRICSASLHPLDEGGPVQVSIDPDDGVVTDEECVLAGMRDAAPGRYVYSTDYQVTEGWRIEHYLIDVLQDRQVTFAHYQESVDPGDPVETHTYDPALTCTLVDAAVFDDCLMSYDDGDYETCVMPTSWWKSCTPLGPSCQPP